MLEIQNDCEKCVHKRICSLTEQYIHYIELIRSSDQSDSNNEFKTVVSCNNYHHVIDSHMTVL
jgi:hypothetical protein